MMTDSAPETGQRYVIDAEDATETARLMYQDRLMTQNMGGVFPERTDMEGIKSILDVACGPGGWTMEAAYQYPEIEIIGIDISQTTLEYARAQAEVQRLQNISFLQMDATKPLAFPDASFDLVNARLVAGFLHKTQWPTFIQECMRVIRPGGIIRLTESEMTVSNQPASEQLSALGVKAFYLSGRSFSPDGRQFCITPMLRPLLAQAGCQAISHRAYALDYSAGAEAHESFCQNAVLATALMRPFFTKSGALTEEKFDQLHQQFQIEIQLPEFAGLWYYLTVWGQKPLEMGTTQH